MCWPVSRRSGKSRRRVSSASSLYHVLNTECRLITSSIAKTSNGQSSGPEPAKRPVTPDASVKAVREQYDSPPSGVEASPRRQSSAFSSKIVLTSHPGQSGVDPLPMDWGNSDPDKRGPVVVSRHRNTIRRRNGTSPCPPFEASSLTAPSHRCPRRFIRHLPRSCRSKQELGH